VNFNQPEYGVLLFFAFWGFWALRQKATTRELLLLTASYTFYGAWNPRYLPLLILSTVVDYYVARGLSSIQSPGKRRALLILSLSLSLGLLATFKYFNFFAEQAATGLAVFGLRVRPARLNVLLPAGISFYTFQTMNYVIDVYRRKLRPASSLLEFAVFVSFFPHLVAGPILRASYFLPQVEREPTYDHAAGVLGVQRILVGLCKKAVFADYVGYAIVDPAFRHLATMSAAGMVLAMYAYAVQIYSDFSGYSDIAIGSALLLGFRIPENFDHPYLAQSPREFWARWHISLSTWLRDYLYIPLGGNRGTATRTCLNLMLTMLLGGLWHGANWTFVVWGGLHGLALVLTRPRSSQATLGESAARVFGRRLVFFHFVCLTWLFFRAPSLSAAVTALRRLATGTMALALTPDGGLATVLVFIALAAHFGHGAWKAQLLDRFLLLPVGLQGLIAATVVLLVGGLGALGEPFIYFQF
jgi:D-alanyl-lipoteichoic acid acyltransferase DltB (MBOAT superfamily)